MIYLFFDGVDYAVQFLRGVMAKYTWLRALSLKNFLAVVITSAIYIRNSKKQV